MCSLLVTTNNINIFWAKVQVKKVVEAALRALK